MCPASVNNQTIEYQFDIFVFCDVLVLVITTVLSE